MSGSSTAATITVPTPPVTAEVAADMAAWIGGQSGVLTDFNYGSQVRTEAEAVGSVVEMQAAIAQAQAFQAMVYAAWSAFNVFPLLAQSATGPVTFSTGSGANPPLAPSPITIPAGTTVQTVGGIQYTTATTVVIPTGGTAVSGVVDAVVAGSAGNVAAGAITQIASDLTWPLQVINNAPITGGTDAETPAQTMARFTTVVNSIGRGTPVAVANSCVGVSVSGTGETVLYATCYEPWVTEVAEGQTENLTVGFDVYVDNGSGTASSNLLAAVATNLNGSFALGEDGYRPAGVPYNVYAVQPLYCLVVVSGTAIDSSLDASLASLTTTAVNQYFSSLGFGIAAEYPQLVASIANQVAGNVSSLGIQLLNVSGVSVNTIQPLGYQRVIVQNLQVDYN